MKSRHVFHCSGEKPVFFFGELVTSSVERYRSHAQAWKWKRLDRVLNVLNRNVALEVEANVIRRLVHPDLPPAIFDDAVGFNAGHSKRLCLHFETTGFYQGPFEHIFLLELDNGAI